ncbi:ATP synthase subunit d, mitochondrial-like [Amphiura filiformis]|uniref:ATP synthase subunit d, mitochondrial-like n=1 Tax=Amphiura filiformis TaxID=82378 RepID=UPI003B2134E3
MASRRVGQKVIDWAAFAERVPPNQKSQFNALKSHADALKARYNATPEVAPALDWAMYKKTVPIPGLVDKFEKQYKETKVPFPSDPVTTTIDTEEKEFNSNLKNLKAEAQKRIAEYEEQAKKFTGMVPFEEMTIEEFDEYFPELSMEVRRKKYPFPHYPPQE